MQTLETTAPATDYVADGDMTAALELLYLTQKGVNAHLIDVATQEGIVKLTGIADNLLARERAEDIALALRGVRGVVNEILISTPDVPDAELQASVTLRDHLPPSYENRLRPRQHPGPGAAFAGRRLTGGWLRRPCAGKSLVL